MTSKFVQLTRQQCIRLAIIFDRVENRNTIGRQSNRSPKKMRLGRQRILCNDGREWNAPRIVAEVRLRKRYLLLPSRNANHHLVVRHRVGFDIKELDVLPMLNGV